MRELHSGEDFLEGLPPEINIKDKGVFLQAEDIKLCRVCAGQYKP